MKFPLGRLVATPSALTLLGEVQIEALVSRHSAGDWGLVCIEDAEANEWALANDARILSVYVVDDTRIYIITEADRSSTCVLLAKEY